MIQIFCLFQCIIAEFQQLPRRIRCGCNQIHGETIEYTGDESYIRDYGIHVMVEIARFWACRASYQPDKDCYMLLIPYQHCGAAPQT